jgi:hypothetical protein
VRVSSAAKADQNQTLCGMAKAMLRYDRALNSHRS